MHPHTTRSLATPRRIRWLVTALTVVGLLALMISAAVPASAAVVAPLTGSTFEAGDGNLAVDTTGFHDWNSPIQAINCGTTIPTVGTNCSTDLTKSTVDNAFGQGTKEDSPNVTVVDGSIPPNKSDLTRLYVNTEFANNNNFLYLAWERSNVLGSANMDFEINQVTTPGLCDACTGPVTINRTAGDLLVTYDFSGGGSVPTLGLLRWVTSGSTTQCFSSNALPCWGNAATINSSNSQGAINTGDVVDTNPPNAPTTLPANTFGEVGINLTTAGIFPAGTCVAFGSAFLKSRASASFGSEVKDFIAPVPVNISNCGEVHIIKHTDPRGLNQTFSYTSNIPNPVGTSDTPHCTSDSTPSSFTLNDSGNTGTNNNLGVNTEDCTKVLAGSYTVTEGAEPANFTLESLTCNATTGSSGAQDSTNPSQANITIIPEGSVTCTYTNKGSGAIRVTKTAKNHNLNDGLQHPLAGATFKVNGVSQTTGTDGTTCFDGLNIGQSYTVTETSAPTGYSIDTASKDVTVSAAASCTSGTPAAVSFTDSPLTDVTITAKSEVSGVTNSTITCVVSGTTTGIGNSPQGPTDPVTVTANGLKPGTYVCTVVVDP